MHNRGPSEKPTRLKVKHGPRPRLGKLKIPLHGGNGAQWRRAPSYYERLPLSKTVSFRRFKVEKHVLRASQTWLENHAISGEVKLGTNITCPLERKLGTTKKGKKG